MIDLFQDRIETPIGDLLVISDGRALRAVEYASHEERGDRLLDRAWGAHRCQPATDPGGASAALRRYFDGEPTALDGLEVALGGTAFQRRVWLGLRSIPWGTTLSYGDFAKRLDVPKAVRAVGRTNGLNPIAIVLPCHRVIGANGKLTGYAGGLERKAWLLAHEGIESPTTASPARQPDLFDAAMR